eukprot:scaffold133183_cov30-Tisochrysis_lutea.AAC.1
MGGRRQGESGGGQEVGTRDGGIRARQGQVRVGSRAGLEVDRLEGRGRGKCKEGRVWRPRGWRRGRRGKCKESRESGRRVDGSGENEREGEGSGAATARIEAERDGDAKVAGAVV